jgi:hypothetical protein
VIPFSERFKTSHFCIQINLQKGKTMKIKMSCVSMLSVLTAFLILLNMNLAGCKKDSTNVADNLPDITGYPIVSTNQTKYYDTLTEISAPVAGSPFYGQDAMYAGNSPNYVNNGDGTVTDMVTGLMWQQTPDRNGDGTINASDKVTYSEAIAGASSCKTGGHADWRLPTIKELYSLILFSGIDPSGYEGSSTDGLVPFINTNYFRFGYGDTGAEERIIDAQFVSSTKYVDYTMIDFETVFGVNFADGRIKGYGLTLPWGEKTFYLLYVRGNKEYGKNNFTDNGNGTICDNATGLMWMQDDSGQGMNWPDALTYAENFQFGGYSDWRLPDVKELQSIVDYTRSPSTTGSAAIDPLFQCTGITNEAGTDDFPFYWTSTTHVNWSAMAASCAAYVSFGRAMGYMTDPGNPSIAGWIDVHGAGCQRSDPKTGNAADFPYGRGPQGDAIRILNHVRLVRNIN